MGDIGRHEGAQQASRARSYWAAGRASLRSGTKAVFAFTLHIRSISGPRDYRRVHRQPRKPSRPPTCG